MTIPHDIRKRLLYSKYLLSRAKKAQTEKSELSVAVSVLLMHDSAELVMHSVADHLGISKWGFKEFWDKVKQRSQKEPGFKIPMEQLNSLRVGFKHHGTLPHSSTAIDLMPRVEAFCEETSKEFLSCSLQGLSLADLVNNNDVRTTLLEAAQAIVKGDKQKAFLNVRLAFDKLHRIITNDVDLVRKPRGIDLRNSALPKTTAREIENLQGVVFDLVNTVNVLMIGVDPVMYRYLRENTPATSWTQSGKHQAVIMGNYEDKSDDVFNKCFEFVVDVALNASM